MASQRPSFDRRSDDSSSHTGPRAPAPLRRIGQFDLRELLGRDGDCDVFRGYDATLDRPVTLRVLSAEFAGEQKVAERFRRESAATARIDHPNVVPVHFVGQDAGRPFVVLQHVEGEPLAELLRRRGRLPVGQAVALIEQCLAGLEAAHAQGLLHRELDPARILVERHSGRVLLGDFRLAAAPGGDRHVPGDAVSARTADYLPPEQARGETADQRSDLYSFGVLLDQLLAGRPPSAADAPLDAAAPELPGRLVQFVARMMAEDPADRYADCRAALAELRACGPEVTQISARPGGVGEWSSTRRDLTPGPSPARAKRRWACLLAAIALVVALAFFVKIGLETARTGFDTAADDVAQPAGVRSPSERPPASPGKAEYQPLWTLSRDSLRKKTSQLLSDAAAAYLDDYRRPSWAHLEKLRASLPDDGIPRTPGKTLLDGCVLYMTFEPETLDKRDGRTIVQDLSGLGHHALVHGTRLGEGRVGRGMEFDGQLSHLALPALTGKVFADLPVQSFSLWMKQRNYTRSVILLDVASWSRVGIDLRTGMTPRSFWLACNASPNAIVNGVGAGAWHHLGGVNNLRMLVFYVDGRVAAEGPSQFPSGMSRDYARAGSLVGGSGIPGASVAPGTSLDGVIDELLVFRRPLAEAEMKELYRIGLEGRRPEPAQRLPPVGDFPPPEDGTPCPYHSIAKETARESALEDELKARIGSLDGCDPELIALLKTFLVKPSRASPEDVLDLWHRMLCQTSDGRLRMVHGVGSPAAVRFVESRSGRQVWQGEVLPTRLRLHELALSPDDQCVACCGASPVVRLLPVNRPDEGRNLDTGMVEVYRVAFSPDGARLLVGGWATEPGDREAPLALWDVASLRKIREYRMPGRVSCAAFSPHGARILAGLLEERSLRVLDPADGREISRFHGHAGAPLCAAFFPDGRRVASAGMDGSIHLWDSDNGRPIREIKGHLGPVADLKLLADGRHAVSCGGDATCRLWDLDEGRLLRRVIAPAMASFRAVALSRDERVAYALTQRENIIVVSLRLPARD